MAYALSVFDEETYSDLKVIKKIRNVFAHPKGLIKEVPNFDDSVIIDICKKFKGYDASQTTENIFDRKVAKCILLLSKDPDDTERANKILSQPPKRVERAP